MDGPCNYEICGKFFSMHSPFPSDLRVILQKMRQRGLKQNVTVNSSQDVDDDDDDDHWLVTLEKCYIQLIALAGYNQNLPTSWQLTMQLVESTFTEYFSVNTTYIEHY